MSLFLYNEPSRIWVEEGHVFVEAYDGATIRMTPEVALHLSRKLGAAGGDALISKVRDLGAPEGESLPDGPPETAQRITKDLEAENDEAT